MLERLHIKNIALIDQANIEFEKGMNCISGETGAGKSVLIDSLSFVIGDRADKSLIKYGEDFAVVEAIFEIDEQCKASIELKSLGLYEGNELILSRQMSILGKNEIRINGKLSTLNMLKQITVHLVDIFGQSEHLNLLKVDKHLDILDGYKCSNTIKTELAELLSKYNTIQSELKGFGGSESERMRTIDLLKFQVEEIQSAALFDGEEAQLIERKCIILNTEKIKNGVCESIQLLSDNSDSAITALSISLNNIINISKYDEKLNLLSKRLESVKYELIDVTEELESYSDILEFSEDELSIIEMRLDLIKTLKKKYGKTVLEINDYGNTAQNRLEYLENATVKIDKLNKEKTELINKMYKLSIDLSNSRKQIALEFSSVIQSELKDLGMKGAQFKIQFNATPTIDEYYSCINANGFDKVEFLMTANIGEPLKPLVKVISGGEMSRFMLAIKNITARIEEIPTMVFDEIDTGISGKMAQMVAVKLANVSTDYQSIVITHLPQIAAIADNNYLIEKEVIDNHTKTIVKELNYNDKITEISRLIGGDVGSHAILHAKDMVDWGEKIKKDIR
ncbi:MAG: DNA repair protein RecN [Clostridia bacterium]